MELDHREYSNKHNPIPFKEKWVGDNPDTKQRRAYMVKYFTWFKPNHQRDLSDLIQEAKWEAAATLHKADYNFVTEVNFAFMVNEHLWALFFSYYPDSPDFPWSEFPADELKEYSRQYPLYRERIAKGETCPEAGESNEALIRKILEEYYSARDGLRS